MQDLSLFIQSHWTLSLLLGVLLLLLFVVELIRLKRAAQQLSPLQLIQLINHQNAAVIDLRPTAAFAKGHIIGALSLPLPEFKENAKKIDKMKARPVVLVCAKGLDSPKIASLLKNQGFTVHLLKGGIQNWIGADMPLSKD
jgi:rhodanese-related sulfurtransferase